MDVNESVLADLLILFFLFLKKDFTPPTIEKKVFDPEFVVKLLRPECDDDSSISPKSLTPAIVELGANSKLLSPTCAGEVSTSASARSEVKVIL